MPAITVIESQRKKCKEFAEACAPTNSYNNRGQTNMQKRKQDIYYGKMAEVAVARFFRLSGYDINEPDFEIYRGRAKSHGKDLMLGKIPIEIKSQTIDSMKKYGMSWLLEKKAIPKLKNHIMVFCTIIDDETVMINNVCEFDELIFGEPKLKHLTSKAAIYYDDILKLKLENL